MLFTFNNRNRNSNILISAINYIIKEGERNFPEMKHIMFLGKEEGFSNFSQTHIGDIFQLALVGEMLLEINESNILAPMLKNIEKVFTNKITHEGSVIAWKYFPSVTEISCDIDDLAQVMRFLLSFDKTNKKIQLCIKTIDEIVIKDNYDKRTKAFQTWIMPKSDKIELQLKQDIFNKSKWGEGPHVEVNANFGICLYEIDKIKYDYWITKIAEYLQKTRSEDGFWESRWYYGN